MDFYVIYTPTKPKVARRSPCYIVRRWIGHVPDDEPLGKATSIEAARRFLPDGLKRLKPLNGDDPAIREIWV